MSTDDVHTTPSAGADAGRFAVAWTALRDRLAAQDLLDAVRAGTAAPETFDVTALTADSREVEPGGAFVAVRGTTADGHAFIDDAIEHGARLVVCETLPEAPNRFAETTFLRVTDARAALAEAAAALYDDPGDALTLVGVTGTNGKTTVAWLVHHLLDDLGDRTGLLSTIEVRTGGETDDTFLTTPGPVELQRTLRCMVDRGCTACAMEVSSHALDQKRVYGLDYAIAIFTNLTADHLDYHGSVEAYRNAKKTLFDGLGAEATALYNADDEAGPEMVADTAATPVSFALERDADLRPEVRAHTLDGLRLALDGRERQVRLAGRFNAYNVAAAYGVGRALGYEGDAVLDGLAGAPPVPGRFETMHFEDDRTVVVDYAHTPDALDNILRAVREVMPADAALWCVFGCGGDRDTTKRGRMGGIAEQRADRVIVTSDNPRTEAPEAILRDIRDGVHRPDAMRWIVHREDAIATAAEEAAPGDVVVIAGKGHETYQVIGTEKHPFDDRERARAYFS